MKNFWLILVMAAAIGFFLGSLVSCTNPAEPPPKIEWQPDFMSAPAECHRARDMTQCIIKFTAATLISISVPFACTSVPLCIGAVAGAGLAWNDYFRENAIFLDPREERGVR